MILIQLKSSQARDALGNIEGIQDKIFKQTGYRIRGHEVQMVGSVLAKTTLKERTDHMIDFCSRRDAEFLTYHCPIFQGGQNIWDPRWKETLRASILTTAEEAQGLAERLHMKNKIILVAHLTNYIPLSRLPITAEEKFAMQEDTKREFLSFYVDRLKKEFPNCCLAVENSYPKYGRGYASTGPFHPKEIVLPAKFGIGTVLDLAHYYLYSNYVRAGKGNQCGDLDRSIYGASPDWGSCIRLLASNLVQLHISNARGNTAAGEGLPVMEGEIDVVEVLREVHRSVPRLVQGTVELSDGHLYSGRLQFESVLWLLGRVPGGEIFA